MTPERRNRKISIHALRAEGDIRTSCRSDEHRSISIHALRAEGDATLPRRLPCRPISIHALRAEGDSTTTRCSNTETSFLSTPSVRRATFGKVNDWIRVHISIHALRAEGDYLLDEYNAINGTFLSTPSVRRATAFSTSASRDPIITFLSTPSVRRATQSAAWTGFRQ